MLLFFFVCVCQSSFCCCFLFLFFLRLFKNHVFESLKKKDSGEKAKKKKNRNVSWPFLKWPDTSELLLTILNNNIMFLFFFLFALKPSKLNCWLKNDKKNSHFLFFLSWLSLTYSPFHLLNSTCHKLLSKTKKKTLFLHWEKKMKSSRTKATAFELSSHPSILWRMLRLMWSWQKKKKKKERRSVQVRPFDTAHLNNKSEKRTQKRRALPETAN